MTYAAVAAHLTAPGGPFELRPIDLPEPGPDEVLVRLVATGICHTDLVEADRPWVPGRILGHEGAGVVDINEAVAAARTGQAVKPVLIF